MRRKRIFALKVLLLIFLGLKFMMTEFGWRFCQVLFFTAYGTLRFGVNRLAVFLPCCIVLLELVGGLILGRRKRGELHRDCQECIVMIQEAIDGHRKEN
jgi:hypothetical protein